MAFYRLIKLHCIER